MLPAREIELLRFQNALRARLRDVRSERGVIALALREALGVFGAREVALWVLAPKRRARRVWASAAGSEAVRPPRAEPELGSYLHGGEWPRPADTRLVAPVERRQRRWGVLVLDAAAPFARGEGQGFVAIAGLVAERLMAFDQQRAAEVRERIDRKITAQLRPQDLCYQVLHGLRSLTGYDHSGTFYVSEEGGGRMRLAAEQVAWSKLKSPRIGIRVEVAAEDLRRFALGTVASWVRTGAEWQAVSGSVPPGLVAALGFGTDAPPAGCTLLAPLTDRRGRVLGIVRLAGVEPTTLGPYEAALLQGFVPQATIALGNAQTAETLREAVVRAEREHAMADLARGVAHDVNNALGAVLPIAQQLRSELRDGEVPRETLRADVERIEAAMAVCRRVFAGMLAFAKGAAGRGARHGDMRKAVDNAASILRVTAERRGLRIETEIHPELLPVAGAQHELERLLLNLMSNACDAMSDGGVVRVEVSPLGDQALDVSVRDTGRGMTSTELARIGEAFYTTKESGSGLGLAICKSIVSDMGARMHIDSAPGRGTTVTLAIPVLTQRGIEGVT